MPPACANATLLADRIAGGLWGMFIADALAMPVHWFYGGAPQIERAFGKPLAGYERSPQGRGSFPGSIMALSDTGSAGRGGSEGEIVGTVINHGKKSYWERGSGYHYHVTLQKGESTLEGEMARLVMRSLTKGEFDLDHMQREYVQFMTTPGSHNDAYCSSYHRLFFQRRAAGFPLRDCPSNDGHNVDAIDGLIMPAVVLLGGAAAPEAETRARAQECVRVTRNSRSVESFVAEYSLMLREVLDGRPVQDVAQDAAKRITRRRLDVSRPDPVVACYIDQNFESLLHFAAKYGGDFKKTLLANANAGGENVHRGLVLGALMGAHVGKSGIPEDLRNGLYHAAGLEAEIDAFVAAHIGSGGGATCNM